MTSEQKLKNDIETEINDLKYIERKKKELKADKEEYEKKKKRLVKINRKLEDYELGENEIDEDEFEQLENSKQQLDLKVSQMKREIENELVELRKLCKKHNFYEYFETFNPMN